MKKRVLNPIIFSAGLILPLFSLTILAGCNKKETHATNASKQVPEERLEEVVAYTYDSFAGEWGPGEELIQKFQETTGKKLTLIDCGEGIQALNRAVLEKSDPKADVIIGIDNNLAPKAREQDILEAYKPKNADKLIDKRLVKELGGDWILTPYDYSHFAMIFDTESKLEQPTSLESLTKDIYKKKIILMDPRTSTPGLGFLSWTVSVYNDKTLEYWKALKPSILTMTASWSEGWGMFQDGEAPLVVSYTTSPAYNVEYDKNYRYKALVFEQGHVEQVEGYGLLKNAPNKEGAKLFMDFMISAEAQNALPLTQWMYPVNNEISLPQSYIEAAPLPGKTLESDGEKTEKILDSVIEIITK
ncbi:MAG: thiamine ABC transporter substrate-binding protein [Treponema sp.]|nr:thiamine ABC transporter substrate-binding protein [Treponema sp.]